jgi:hypothetical protein
MSEVQTLHFSTLPKYRPAKFIVRFIKDDMN